MDTVDEDILNDPELHALRDTALKSKKSYVPESSVKSQASNNNSEQTVFRQNFYRQIRPSKPAAKCYFTGDGGQKWQAGPRMSRPVFQNVWHNFHPRNQSRLPNTRRSCTPNLIQLTGHQPSSPDQRKNSDVPDTSSTSSARASTDLQKIAQRNQTRADRKKRGHRYISSDEGTDDTPSSEDDLWQDVLAYKKEMLADDSPAGNDIHAQIHPETIVESSTTFQPASACKTADCSDGAVSDKCQQEFNVDVIDSDDDTPNVNHVDAGRIGMRSRNKAPLGLHKLPPSGNEVSEDKVTPTNAVREGRTLGIEDLGDDLSGNEQSRNDPSSDAASGDESSGDETSGNEAAGEEASEDEASGDCVSGDEASEEEASEDEASGDGVSGDEASGVESPENESSENEASPAQDSGNAASFDEYTFDEHMGDEYSVWDIPSEYEGLADEALGSKASCDKISGGGTSKNESSEKEASGSEESGSEASEVDDAGSDASKYDRSRSEASRNDAPDDAASEEKMSEDAEVLGNETSSRTSKAESFSGREISDAEISSTNETSRYNYLSVEDNVNEASLAQSSSCDELPCKNLRRDRVRTSCLSLSRHQLNFNVSTRSNEKYKTRRSVTRQDALSSKVNRQGQDKCTRYCHEEEKETDYGRWRKHMTESGPCKPRRRVSMSRRKCKRKNTSCRKELRCSTRERHKVRIIYLKSDSTDCDEEYNMQTRKRRRKHRKHSPSTHLSQRSTQDVMSVVQTVSHMRDELRLPANDLRRKLSRKVVLLSDDTKEPRKSLQGTRLNTQQSVSKSKHQPIVWDLDTKTDSSSVKGRKRKR